ncbi:hypothetical protein [Clostridium ljungdahlii]|uniref:Uncharacterized protein n=1 Tax=Clostridium ljungdahlii (strain ATCC 55383 / DSM 13528 / PETC) TaxID=748727 RepID=D8GU64_CLOLD|nr:hypothetical protein [Clostridium ljungdahlii]ADK14727.1 hypothetical protein CLJU_c16630 [Clostridium ljungdahlii DSM 13528]OAA84083.1 hypothetical protein WX45_01927 [Clostridium ljungdahlii DSM 13528]
MESLKNFDTEKEEIKIYRQYSGLNDEPYYFTFDKNKINHVNLFPYEMPLTKENIVLTILDTQVISDDEGNIFGDIIFENKTQGMKLKKTELIQILEKCYNLYKKVKGKCDK